ncbi:lactococcin 972 family bacteriocin [Streptomyces sp. NPDC001978]|uniref:lactococcin 972 family bacteriocin n=1 Tax=Streptomyces sp. NPDC001978 TaxID=3364627 RepID=UPI0036C46A2B
MVEITNTSAGSITPQTVLNIGGGTWSYGSYLTTGGKYCYSNYYHGSVVHGSTAAMAGHSIKAVAGPGDYSYAHLTAGAAYTCSTYYAKY